MGARITFSFGIRSGCRQATVTKNFFKLALDSVSGAMESSAQEEPRISWAVLRSQR
jgi:hypothetical protein